VWQIEDRPIRVAARYKGVERGEKNPTKQPIPDEELHSGNTKKLE